MSLSIYFYLVEIGTITHKGVWKCYETSDPTKPAPARTIPNTSNYFDADKQMFVYGFSKVSRIKELAK